MFAKELSIHPEFEVFFDPLTFLTVIFPDKAEDRQAILHLLDVVFQKSVEEWWLR